MKQKGFTLIELLAVIVILAILMLVAGSNVFGILDKAQRGSFRTEFLQLLQSAQTKAQIDIMNGAISGSDRGQCYSIADLDAYFDNKGGYVGSVKVNYENGKLTLHGWMSSDKYIIENEDDSLQANETDVKNNNGTAASSECGK